MRTQGAELERTAVRGYMVARSLAGPAAAAYALGSPGELPLAFWLVFAAGHVLGFAAVAVAFSGAWRRLRPEYTLPLDIVVLAVLLALSGGAQSELRNLVLAMMIAPAMVMPPRFVASAGCALLVAYAAAALPDLARGEEGAGGEAASFLLGLLWATGTAVTLSTVRTRTIVQIERLRDGRRLLLGAVLDAEARDRRSLTAALHEGALQHLLTARQELDEVQAEDPSQRVVVDRAEAEIRAAITELRSTIADLHPVALEHAGLTAGLRAIVQRAADRGGFLTEVEVEREAEGIRDELIVNVARELVSNVVEHARAGRLSVRVRAEGDGVSLEVEDDGVGFDPLGRHEDAMGLAACSERIASAEGSFQVVSSADGGGTRVRVELGPQSALRLSSLP